MSGVGIDALGDGILLAAILAGEDAGGALQRLTGAGCQAYRERYRDLDRLCRTERLRATRALSQRVLSPLPEGFVLIDPSWIARELAPLAGELLALAHELVPASSLRALGLTATPRRCTLAAQLKRQLGQLLFVGLVPMRVAALPALAWPLARLSRALSLLGLQILAGLARGGDASAQRSLAARLAPPWADLFSRALERPTEHEPPTVGIPRGRHDTPSLLLGLGLRGAGPVAGPALAQRFTVKEVIPFLAQLGPALSLEEVAALLDAAEAWAEEER